MDWDGAGLSSGDYSDADEVTELRTRCVSFLFECPASSAMEDCPFAEIRKREVMERVRWLRARPAKELKAMLRKHAKCMSER
jgi:hypothetical protein